MLRECGFECVTDQKPHPLPGCSGETTSNVVARRFEMRASPADLEAEEGSVKVGGRRSRWPGPPTRPRGHAPGPGEARLEIAGCGVCHTDLGFLHGGVRTRMPLPLTLGHEIVGRIDALGPGAEDFQLEPGQAVVVPAVLPCGECAFCRSGRDNSCTAQKMPGKSPTLGTVAHPVAVT